MPFLALNGWPIEVREIKERAEYLGGIKRVFKGTARNFSQAIKRRWEVTTTPMPIEEAEALKLFVAGVGDHFSFLGRNTWSNSLSDLTSDKGVIPTAGSAILSPGELDGFNVVWGYRSSTTNLLSQNQASFETDLSGWAIQNYNNAVNIARSSDHSYHGNYALQVWYKTASDTAWSISTDVPVVAGNTYTLSWYQKNSLDLSSVSGSDPYNTVIIWKNSSGGEISRTTLTNLGPANMNWHRISFSGTAPTGATTATIRIGFDTPDVNSASHRIYIDGIQLEASSTATPFAYTTQTYSTLKYSGMDILNSTDFTIFARFKLLVSLSSSTAICYLYTPTGYNSYELWVGLNSSRRPYFIYVSETYSPTFYTAPTQVSVGQWNTIAMTRDTTAIRYFLNGSQLSQTSSPAPRLLRPDAEVYLNPTFYAISDVYLLPYALPSTAIEGIHSCPYTSKFPELIAYGDFLPSPYVTVLGEIQDFDYIQYYHNGNWTTGQIVKFSLYEV